MPNPHRADDAWIRRLFFTLAVLYVLPFWTVRYLPTTDGPCHTYNAWVLRQYGNVQQYPLFHQYYEIHALPYPNWTGHAVMALLMFAVPPLSAEKLLVSGYVLLFLAGAWYLAGSVRPGERWPAFLAFFFPYNQLFQFGFYNFSISLAVYLFVLGFWWRHRERPDLRFAVGINLLLWLCWFSHVLSFCLALLSIAVLWLATLRRATWRRHLLHLPILIPQIPLPLWFFRTQGSETEPVTRTFTELREYLWPPHVLFSFSRSQLRLAEWVAAAFLLLFLLTLWRETLRRDEGRRWPVPRDADAFLLLVVFTVLLFFFAPEGMSGGTMLTNRLSLYPYLLLIPWLSPRLGSRWKTAGVAVLSLGALVNLGYLVHWYRLLGEEMRQFVAGLDPVRPGSRVLPLVFQRRLAAGYTDVFGHATGYAALEKGLIDWNNYEATMTYFPVRFRPDVQFPQLEGVEFNPGTLRVRANRPQVDAVYTWQMPEGERLRFRLARDYDEVAEKDGGELYERRPHRQAARGGS
ncbi:MAG: hypothetical protein QOF89_4539 [Acidobacteriota bacterium]|jgi:hypothetical protein|nr:hypothetical protein [Acidobacteriota bacterium]